MLLKIKKRNKYKCAQINTLHETIFCGLLYIITECESAKPLPSAAIPSSLCLYTPVTSCPPTPLPRLLIHHVFYHWRELPQVLFLSRQTRVCREKRFVSTSILLSRQKTCFVAKNTCDKIIACRDKTRVYRDTVCLSRHNFRRDEILVLTKVLSRQKYSVATNIIFISCHNPPPTPPPVSIPPYLLSFNRHPLPFHSTSYLFTHSYLLSPHPIPCHPFPPTVTVIPTFVTPSHLLAPHPVIPSHPPGTPS